MAAIANVLYVTCGNTVQYCVCGCWLWWASKRKSEKYVATSNLLNMET